MWSYNPVNRVSQGAGTSEMVLRIREAIWYGSPCEFGRRSLQIALVFVTFDEAVRDADGSTPVGDTPGELVDGLCLVEAGEAEVVVRAVNGDVLLAVFLELGHEGEEVFLAAFLAEIFGGEVRVHAGAVPVALERFAVILDIDTVFLAKALEQVAGDPDLVRGTLGAFSENLELPLAFGDLGVDALVIDAGREADVEVLVDDGAGDAADIRVTHTAVILTLRIRIATGREAERKAVFHEEILLLESEPRGLLIEDGRAGVGRMRGLAVRHHDFAHDDGAVLAGGVRIDGHWLEHAVGAAALGLACRTAVESPHRELLELGERGELLDLGFSTDVRNRCVSVQPEVFQYVFFFRHVFFFLFGLAMVSQ